MQAGNALVDREGAWAFALALALGVVLLFGLSDDAWRLLRVIWAGLSTLFLMALLEPLRRGLSRKGGGLPLSVFAKLAVRGVLLGLMLASLSVALLAV